MKRLRGPELKMPELRMPRFLVDLFYDLHDRRLLPLVALVIVAIFAVPFLLGGDSEEIGPPPSAGLSSISRAPGSQAAHLTVVEAAPGLRDYHKRLARRRPTDPFRQRYTSPVAAGAQLNSETTTSTMSTDTTTTSTTTTSTATDIAAPSDSPVDKGGDGGEPGAKLTFFTFAIDVKIVRSESGKSGTQGTTESIKHGVEPTTPLPGEKAPVVTYMGVKDKASKVLLMVSNNVTSVFGDGKCLSGTDVCQLIEVEPGFPQTFVYGPNDVRYRINVLKIEPVVTGHS